MSSHTVRAPTGDDDNHGGQAQNAEYENEPAAGVGRRSSSLVPFVHPLTDLRDLVDRLDHVLPDIFHLMPDFDDLVSDVVDLERCQSCGQFYRRRQRDCRPSTRSRRRRLTRLSSLDAGASRRTILDRDTERVGRNFPDVDLGHALTRDVDGHRRQAERGHDEEKPPPASRRAFRFVDLLAEVGEIPQRFLGDVFCLETDVPYLLGDVSKLMPRFLSQCRS